MPKFTNGAQWGLVLMSAGLALGVACKKKKPADEKKNPPTAPAADSDKAKKAAEAAKKAEAEKKPVQAQPKALGAAMSLAGLLPASTEGMVAVDLQRTAKSPLWKQFRSSLDQATEVQRGLKALQACGLQESDVHHVMVGYSTKAETDGVVVMRGNSIGDAAKVRCVLNAVQAEAQKSAAPDKKKGKKAKKRKKKGKKSAPAAKPGFVEQKRGDRVVFEIYPQVLSPELAKEVQSSGQASVAEKMYLLPIDNKRLVFCDPSHLDEVIKNAAANKPAESLPAGLAALRPHLGGEQSLIMAGKADKNWSQSLSAYNLQGLKDYRLSVDLSQNLALAVSLGMQNRAQASMSADALRSQLAEQKPLLQMLSLPSKLIDDIKIAGQEDRVVGNMSLSAADIKTLSSALGGMMGGIPGQ